MPPAKRPNEPAEPLHEVLKSLVALQEHAAASQQQMRESSEALIEANRSTLEVLTQRLIDATGRSARDLSAAMLKSRSEQLAVVVQPPAEDATTREQRLRQQQLVLTYNAFRTMLGRTPGTGSSGAAVVFMADRVDGAGKHDPDSDSIKILSPAPFRAVEDGWTLVLITTTGQTLYAPMHRDKVPARVQVEHLSGNLDVARLEIRDHDDNPLYLGLGPATQTHNARKHKRREIAGKAVEPADADMTDEDPRVSYHDGISAPTPELDPGIR
ncbi:MAG: hypothetical protein ACXVUE_08880 [Solirubrobacteraceae bacterium]